MVLIITHTSYPSRPIIDTFIISNCMGSKTLAFLSCCHIELSHCTLILFLSVNVFDVPSHVFLLVHFVNLLHAAIRQAFEGWKWFYFWSLHTSPWQSMGLLRSMNVRTGYERQHNNLNTASYSGCNRIDFATKIHNRTYFKRVCGII